MNKQAYVMVFGVAAMMAGCATNDVDGDPALSTTTENLVVAPGAFVALYATPANSAVFIPNKGPQVACGFNEVMIGIHVEREQVTCAALNFGYKIQSRVIDAPHTTQVGNNPRMHGCPQNFFIQSMILEGDDEELSCVSLQTADNIALTYSSTYQDGNSPPTASQGTYNILPNMHVCRPSFAMVGIHQDRNNLFCAD